MHPEVLYFGLFYKDPTCHLGFNNSSFSSQELFFISAVLMNCDRRCGLISNALSHKQAFLEEDTGILSFLCTLFSVQDLNLTEMSTIHMCYTRLFHIKKKSEETTEDQNLKGPLQFLVLWKLQNIPV